MVLTDNDRQLIAIIQHGLPLTSRPYAAIGRQLGLGEAEVIVRLEALQADGLIKRMGVVVRHRALGYRANAMVVWDVPASDIKQVGELLAGEDCVTLCYQRPRRLPDWPYNLFCMIHGRERDGVLRRLGQMIERHGLENLRYEVLFSGRSFKQRGAFYADTRPAVIPGEVAHG
jgi:DNA-binding Lrp family transcriptional regulator